MHIECPNCHSGYSERLVLTWAKGLSHQKSTSVSVGALIGNIGDTVKKAVVGVLAFGFWPVGLPWLAIAFIKPMIAISRTWATSQTVLSAETKPPYRFKFWKYLFIGIALVLCAFAAWISAPTMLALFGVKLATKSDFQRVMEAFGVGGVTLALVATGLYFGVRYNRKIWPLLEARWQRSFRCVRCGTIYLSTDFDPVGVNKVVSYGRIGKAELLPRAHTQEQVKAVEAKALDFDETHIRKKGRGILRPIGK